MDLHYLLKRFQEPSTWASLAAVGSLVVGHQVSSETVVTVAQAGSLVAGLIGVLVPENPVDQQPE